MAKFAPWSPTKSHVKRRSFYSAHQDARPMAGCSRSNILKPFSRSLLASAAPLLKPPRGCLEVGGALIALQGHEAWLRRLDTAQPITNMQNFPATNKQKVLPRPEAMAGSASNIIPGKVQHNYFEASEVLALTAYHTMKANRTLQIPTQALKQNPQNPTNP